MAIQSENENAHNILSPRRLVWMSETSTQIELMDVFTISEGNKYIYFLLYQYAVLMISHDRDQDNNYAKTVNLQTNLTGYLLKWSDIQHNCSESVCTVVHVCCVW